MKILVNISTIIIMILSASSMTSPQTQQKPSQRCFATVLSKLKEKKKGREKQQSQSPEEKAGFGRRKK